MLTGTYVAGQSWLHRARPGVKILGLLALTTALVVFSRPVALAVGALVVLGAGLTAGLGLVGLWRLARPLMWIVVLLGALQWWSSGGERALTVVGGIVVTVVGAGIVTATTRVEDMLDAVVTVLGPTRRLGWDPERIGLLVALVVRAVPVVASFVTAAREARMARGLDRSPRALLVPVVVRAVRHAGDVGDALVARGVDD